MLFQRFFLPAFALVCYAAAAYPQQRFPRDTSYTVDNVHRQIRKQYPMARPAIDSMHPALMAYRNQVYASLPGNTYGKRELQLDVFRPADRQRYPAVIMVHGGGWRSGTRAMQVPMAQLLAARGFVTVPVEYQLSLEASYPAAVFNIKAAIRWIKANGERFGIDTTKIALSGCSAGGQLAALTGLTNHVPLFEGNQGTLAAGSNVQAIIDMDGVLDFMAPASLNLQRKAHAPDVSWLGGTFETCPATWKEASPIFWARKDHIVPMLFLNSGFPRFHAGQDELTGMLQEWGACYEVHKFEVKVHPFWLFHPWVDTVVDHMAVFLKKVL